MVMKKSQTAGAFAGNPDVHVSAFSSVFSLPASPDELRWKSPE